MSWELGVSGAAQKTGEKQSQNPDKLDLMWKKKQQINKTLTSAYQQERGQLLQENIKQAKGLLK